MEAHTLGLLVSVLDVIKGLSLSSASVCFLDSPAEFNLSFLDIGGILLALTSERKYCQCWVVNFEECYVFIVTKMLHLLLEGHLWLFKRGCSCTDIYCAISDVTQ